MAERGRLYYLDNLKVLLIVLVVIHHAGQAYGLTGGAWFYSYPGERVKPLGLLFLFNASFFMGLFFFISGYFIPSSFDRHGARKFIFDKLIRFGIPLVLAAFLIIPILEYVKYLHDTNSIGYQDFYIQHWLGYAPEGAGTDRAFSFAHLWFVEHLLVYSILYAAIRSVLQKFAPSLSIPTTLDVRSSAIVLYMAVLGFTTHLMRSSWGFPVNHWIFFLGFMQMEPAHIPQYLSLFVLGILAYRYSLLESITRPRRILWLIPGLGIYMITVVQFFTAGRESAFFLWEYREALLCIGACIGLLALFRTFFNHTGRMVQLLAENAYGAYFIHVPIVVALQYAFDPVQAGAFTLFVIVSLLAIAGSFCAAYLIRLIPGMRRIF